VGGAIAWLAPGRSAAGLGAAAAGIALTAAGFTATFWTLGLASDERRHLRSLVRR